MAGTVYGDESISDLVGGSGGGHMIIGSGDAGGGGGLGFVVDGSFTLGPMHLFPLMWKGQKPSGWLGCRWFRRSHSGEAASS